jgi:hypothetical protein
MRLWGWIAGLRARAFPPRRKAYRWFVTPRDGGAFEAIRRA